MNTIDQHDNAFSMGFYQVGQESYADKLQALLVATQNNIHPEWNFHRDVFDHYDWQSRSGVPLKELYRRRAQQLRDKYSYLTLHYSGGSDSHTILRAFLDNNIPLDEVYVRWPIKALEGNYTPDATNLAVENQVSEWDFVIKPDLEYLARYHPEIKLTVSDWSDEIEPILSNIGERDVLNLGTDWINLGAFIRIHSQSRKHLAHITRGQGAAVILGIDKPRVVKKGHDVFIYFLDIITNLGGSHRTKNVEAFYWTPDLPELIREQSHVIMDFFRANPAQQHLIDYEGSNDIAKKDLYDKITRGLVYPDWNPRKFQANKDYNSVFYLGYDTWLHERYGNSLAQGWRWQIKQVISGIDMKYIKFRNSGPNGFNPAGLVPDGFVGFVSPFYKIGSLKPNVY
jgi:hypothetical protein